MQNYSEELSLLQRAAEKVATTADCSPEELQSLPQHLKLKVLRIKSKRGTLDDTSLPLLVTPDTKVIDLCDCDITDNGLQALRQCRNLQKVDLNAIQTRTAITDAGVQALTSCSLLRVLYLRRCTNVTDSSLIAVAMNCHYLIELNLSGCPNITDATLNALGEHCPQLTSLNAAHTKVTDSGVYGLVSKQSPCGLKELDLSHCSITDESVEAVMMYCPNMRIFVIQGVSISPSAQDALDEMSMGNRMKQMSWTIY